MGAIGAVAHIAALHAQPQWHPIEYTIRLEAPQTQQVDIDVAVWQVTGETLDLALPVWRPGKYLVLDPAGTVEEVRAVNAADEPLPIAKLDKSAWRVQTLGAGAVRVSYRVYCNSLNDRTRHVDATHAFLSPSAVLMYLPARRQAPVVVRIEAPEHWRVACGLEAAPEAPRVLRAPNYDALVDSPLEIGEHDLIEFTAAGKPHAIAVWGAAAYDAAQLKADFAKIIEEQAAIFGTTPYQRYLFIAHIGAGSSGGTEHRNSTVIQASTAALEEPAAYRKFLGLVSHEMFHTWNIKQFRPADFERYDYQRENYSKLLWVVEGTTSYYDDLVLVRAGLIKAGDYLKLLGEAIDAMRRRPGELRQSLEESSFDAWIKFNKPTPDSVNSTVSFYAKGAMVSLALDLEIRARTQNRRSLDDVMRLLYERFPASGPGYTRDDLIKLVEEVAGSPFRPFFADYVVAAEPLPLEKMLSAVGLELYLKPMKRDRIGEPLALDSEDGSENQESDTAELPMIAYLGLNLRDDDGRATVSSVLADGPAYVAGVIPGDEVIALDGRKLSASDLDGRLSKLKPGDEISLAIFRRDRLRELRIMLAGRPDAKWALRRVEEPTESQRSTYESWLGQPWPKRAER